MWAEVAATALSTHANCAAAAAAAAAQAVITSNGLLLTAAAAPAAAAAAKALITGSFSIISQSMAMGCFPRLHVKHTSAKVGGQIYIAGA
jgi:K+ transporter